MDELQLKSEEVVSTPESQFKIFDYIMAMEDRVDQIITRNQEKLQQQYLEKEKRLENEYQLKVKTLTDQLEEKKKAVIDNINRDKDVYEQLIAEKLRTLQSSFSQQKGSICERVLQQINLPFIKAISREKNHARKTSVKVRK